MKRNISLALIFIMLMLALTGCTGNEKIVSDALDKQSKLTSLECKSQLSLKVDIENSGNSPYYDFEPLGFLRELTVNTHDKLNQTADGNDITYASNGDIDFGGLSVKYDLWSVQNSENAKTIIKIPPFISHNLFGDYRDKQYYVIDQKEMSSVMADGNAPKIDNAALQKAAKDFTKKLSDIASKQADLAGSLGFNLVEKTGVKNDKGTEYAVKINDSQLKMLVKFLTIFYGNDKEFNDTLKEFVVSINKNAALYSGSPDDQGIEAINQFFDSRMLSKWGNAIVDAYKDVQLLGSNGLKMSYYIDDNGNITSQTFALDLILNTAKLTAASEKVMGALAGFDSIETEVMQQNGVTEDQESPDENNPIYKVQLNYTMDTLSTDKATIQMPETNDTNSIKLSDILKEQQEQERAWKEQAEIENSIDEAGYTRFYNSLYINGQYVGYEAFVIEKDDKTYIPLRALSNFINGEYSEDSAANTVTLKKGSNTVVITPDSNTALVNGTETDMGVAAPKFGNTVYVPLRFITEALEGTIDYHASSNEYGRLEVTIE